MNNEREALTSYIYDEYKSVHGIRPRWIDFDAMSIEELRAMADRLEAEIISEYERDRQYAEAYKAAKEDPNMFTWISAYYDISNDPYDRSYIRDMERMGNFNHMNFAPKSYGEIDTSLGARLRRDA